MRYSQLLAIIVYNTIVSCQRLLASANVAFIVIYECYLSNIINNFGSMNINIILLLLSIINNLIGIVY